MASTAAQNFPIDDKDGEEEEREVTAAAAGIIEDSDGRGSWKHAAFHVATTIATPAAYAPLPFAVASLGWPLGNPSHLIYYYYY